MQGEEDRVVVRPEAPADGGAAGGMEDAGQ
jgi:hypothetical protein